MNTAVDTTPIPDAAATALAPGAVVLDEFVEARGPWSAVVAAGRSSMGRCPASR